MRVKNTVLKQGYLLLEACFAMAIASIVMISIFQVLNWNLKASQESINSSNKSIKEAAFYSFMERAIGEMSGDAIVQLTTSETERHFLSDLTIQNSSDPFIWSESSFSAKAIKIVTRENSARRLDVIIEYYNDLLLNSSFNQRGSVVIPDQEPIHSLTILKDINRFEWEVWDGQRLDENENPEWKRSWESVSPPRYFKLNTIFDLQPGQDPNRASSIHTFWNPSKVNPLSHFQVLRNRVGQNQNNNSENVQNEANQNQNNEVDDAPR